MKKIEIQAHSSEEAKLIAFKQGITVVLDATKSWKLAGSPVLSREMDMFAAEFLDNKDMLSLKDAGIIIAISVGKENSRKCPFKLNNILRNGRCKLTRTVEIHSKEDNTLLGVAPNKMKAMTLAKELVRKYQVSVYGKTIYVANDIDFNMDYVPSTKTQMGQYIVFAVDESDVRIKKRKDRGFE